MHGHECKEENRTEGHNKQANPGHEQIGKQMQKVDPPLQVPNKGRLDKKKDSMQPTEKRNDTVASQNTSSTHVNTMSDRLKMVICRSQEMCLMQLWYNMEDDKN